MTRTKILAAAMFASLFGCAQSRAGDDGRASEPSPAPATVTEGTRPGSDGPPRNEPAPLAQAGAGADCPGGGDLSRVRYAAELVPAGASCESEVQTRTCTDGMLSGWSGTFAFEGCEVDQPGTRSPGDEPEDPLEPTSWRVACGEGGGGKMLTPRPGEQCYAFRMHESPHRDDVAPFVVNPGESYHEFYFAIPWPAGSVATRIASIPGSPAAYFQTTFASRSARMPGEIDRNALGGVSNAEVLDMGLASRCPRELPQDVGLELPAEGLILIQWHLYNRTGQEQLDDSAVLICTVPATEREHVADVTVLGTERIGEGPLGIGTGEHSASGFCRADTNRDAPWPARLVSIEPHLRDLGIGAQVVVQRGDADPLPLLDVAYDPLLPLPYDLDPRPALQLGDVLTTTCHYNNTTAGNVGLGLSKHTEFCYVLALSYPAGVLSGAARSISLLGAENVCFHAL